MSIPSLPRLCRGAAWHPCRVKVSLLGTISAAIFLTSACAQGEPSEDFDDRASGGSTGGSLSTGGQSPSGGAISTGGETSEPVGEIIPSSDGESFEFRSGDVSMLVTRADGGRIVSFQVEGVETLVQEGAAEYFGSVFWPSPQTWEWPPSSSISEIDSAHYTATSDEVSVTLKSEFNAAVGISVAKTFTPLGNGGIAIEYRMLNSSGQSVHVAPWEVSRVPSGLVFFPTGPAGSLDLEKSNLEVDHVSGVTWYSYEAQGLPETPKFFEDGAEGWLAYAVPRGEGGALVVKTFADLSSAEFAPEESEIELFASTSGQYFEVEHQGPYLEIVDGGEVSWTTIWRGLLVGSPGPAVGDQTYLIGARDLAKLTSR